MPQFSINRQLIGDLVVNTGNVIDVTSSATTHSFVGSDLVDGVATDSDPSIYASRFAGGSGRNVFIYDVINSNIPSGWMKQVSNLSWIAEDGEFNMSPNDFTGILEFKDTTGVIFTAPAGSIPLYDRITCSETKYNGGIGGGEFIVDLGSATGSTILSFDAAVVPDIFKVEYNGVEVINTGYRGTSGTYDGTVVTVAGPGMGTASFTKSTASPTWAKVIVVAPFSGTAWNFSLGCPGGASPPYTPSFGRYSFTGTSTTYGNSLNGGTPFTVDIVYEGGLNPSRITAYSEVVSLPNDFEEVSHQKWTDNNYFNIDITNGGAATISDYSDVVAERVEEIVNDPSGTYVATAYGKDIYSGGDDFVIDVQMNATNPLSLYTFLTLDLSSGSVTNARGPFSEPTLPTNTSTEVHIPLSYSDGFGKVQQIHEGTLFWK